MIRALCVAAAAWLGAWQTMDSGTPARLLRVGGVAGSGTQHVVAVGEHGAVTRFDGKAWRVLPPPADETLSVVVARSPNRIVTAGESGQIWQWDGERWLPPIQAKGPVTAIHMLDDRRGIAATEVGLVRWTGARSTQYTMPDVTFTALVEIAHNVIALGASTSGVGRGFYLGEIAWQPFPQPVPAPYRAVMHHGDLLVSSHPAQGDLLARMHGDEWTIVLHPGDMVIDAWAGRTGMVALTGDATQEIISYHGADWSSEWRGDGSIRLNALWGANVHELLAVGDKGVILQRELGPAPK